MQGMSHFFISHLRSIAYEPLVLSVFAADQFPGDQPRFGAVFRCFQPGLAAYFQASQLSIPARIHLMTDAADESGTGPAGGLPD